jgi:hypothetical protein
MTTLTLAPAAARAAAQSARAPSHLTEVQRRDAAVAAARSASGGRLSAAQKAEVEAIFARVEARKANVSLSRFETVTVSDLRARLEARIVAAVKGAAASCAYRRSESGWVGGEHRTVVRVGGFINAHGASEKVWHAKKAWSGSNSAHAFTVKRDWLSRVERAGLAVLDGLLTLDAKVVDDGLWKATWVEQSTGFSLRAESGYIARNRDGNLQHAPSEAAARRLQAPKAPKAPGKPRVTAADRAADLRARLGDNLDAWAAFADVLVTAADSHKAGNCEAGTRDWSHRWLDGATTTTVGAVLVALEDSRDRTALALAACAYAIVRAGRDRAARKAA